MSTDLQWAWYDQGVKAERARIIALLQTDEAFDIVYYDEMGADGACGDLIALINREEPNANS
jgi:hypothetical protein